MRYKMMVLLFVSIVSLLAFPAVIMAQVQLTETYTSADGKFTMNYPAGWEVNDREESLIVFNGGGTLFQFSFYDAIARGYDPVPALEMLEVGIGSTPEEREMMGYNEPEEVIIAGYPAVVSRSDLMGQLNVVIDLGAGVLGTGIGFGDVATFEPTVMAMMESIHYGDGPQPIVASPLDNLQPITPANAAGVSQVMTLGDGTVSVESLAFSPDGKWLAVGTSDGSVRLWNVATGESQMELTGHTDGVTSLAFGAGGYLLAVGTGSGQVRLWDATTGEGSGMLQKHESPVESVAFTNDFLVASGALDGSVKLWDVASQAEQGDFVDDDNLTPVQSVAFNPDGTLLAVGGESTIRLWDIATASAQAVLETDIGGISTLKFSPDGASLIYGGADPAAWVWDLKDDNHVLLEGHTDQVSALAFSPDGQVIASGDSGAVHLWDATTGGNLAAVPSPSGEAVNSVAFNPDGTLLASAGQTGGVVLWGTTTESAASESTGETSTASITEETTTSASSACTISAPSDANLRSGPGTSFERAGALSAGQTADVDGQAQGTDGMTWYRLASGAWVRSDVITAPAECAGVPVVTP